MNFENFKEKVINGLKEFYQDRIRIEPCSVTKNNGFILDGIYLIKKGETITPTIYLNGYFEMYKSGTSIGEIVSMIVKTYEEYHIEENIDMSFFMDFDVMKKRIVCKLINYERNHDLLSHVPHIQYMDLAIVFYCIVMHEKLQRGTILIQDEHLSNWATNVDELYEIALINNERILGTELKDMNELMLEMLTENPDRIDTDESVQELIESIESENRMPMYIMTNRERQNGAACILNTQRLSDFANHLKKNLYILPSSIHEVILIPENGLEKPYELAKMVHEVNETQVGPEEILSDSIYFFNRSDNRVSSVYSA